MALVPTRSATAATWASSTVILTVGEVAIASDTGVVKVGDGIKTWAQLGVSDNQITSAAKALLVSDETGTGAEVFATSPTFVTPNLGTPSAINLTNATGTPAGLPALAAANTFTVAPQQITIDDPAHKGLIVKGAAAQSANLQEWQNSAATILVYVQSDGLLNIRQNGLLVASFIDIGSFISGAELVVSTPVASNIKLLLRGAVAQTADLQQWQNSSAAVLANLTAGGIFGAQGTDTSAGATVTAPSVTSGVAFTPSTTKNSQVTFQLAGITGSYSITYGPSTGAENAVATNVPTLLNVGDVVSFMVPKGWKVVLTLTTVTLTATLVTTF